MGRIRVGNWPVECSQIVSISARADSGSQTQLRDQLPSTNTIASHVFCSVEREWNLVLDELHLTVSIPSWLPESQIEAIRRTLKRKSFMIRLRQVIRTTFREFPELARVRLSLSR